MSVTAEDITEEFLEFDIQVKDDVLMKLEEIASIFSLQADELVNEWVAYQSRNDQPALTYTELEHLERELANSKTKSSVSKGSEFHDNDVQLDSSLVMNNIIQGYCSPGNKAKLDNIQMKTPMRLQPKVSEDGFSPSVFSPLSGNITPSQKYSSRVNAGEIVTSLFEVENADFSFRQPYGKSTCSVKEDLQTVGSDRKYMFQKIMEVCDILNDTVEDFSEKIMQINDDIESFAPCSAPSQSEVVIVGRIKSENMARLSSLSVLLEGDRVHSYGRSVNVELGELENYSLFPGQVLAMRGINPSGKKFVATKLYYPHLNDGRMKIGESNDFIENTDGLTSIVIAAGPFTTSDLLNYEPLKDLIEIVKKNRPDLTVLVGPILDVNHKEIVNGELNESVFDLANKYIKTIRSDLEDYTQVVFVPSANDAFHHPVFPQPPYSARGSERAHFMSNPCIFRANDILVGATSADVLFHLGAEEIPKSSGGSSDRLARLVQHLLMQNSFYPLYPSHESISVDIPASEFRCKIPQDIGLLILPSDLRCFVKCLQGRLCINPGRLAKGLGGGTYARVLINSDKKVLAQIVRI